jgi:PAS domain S-box-containing protein
MGQVAVAGAPRDYMQEDLAWIERLASLYGRSIRRIREDAEARKCNERLQAALEAAPVGIAALDLEGHVTVWNAGAQRIFGWSEEEVIGRVPPTVPEDRLEETNAAYRDLLACGQRVDYELGRHRKDGRAVDLAVSMAPLADARGALTGMVAVYSDITRRKEAERLLVRANEELSRSNAELEQFAYVASHDLQEPLRMIKGYVQLLERRYRGKLDAQAEEFIGFAVDGATRMKALIDALLEYSRIGSRGREFAPCQTGEALDRALANLKVAIDESGAEIARGDLPEVTADISQLTQLFQNLVGNALKFRGGRTPEIRIGAEERGREWLFRVQDNGIGIPAEHRDRIFEIFQRLHSRQEYAGTGIGLAIAKRIVERHGGRIWVESTPGEGSTFFFSIAEGL